MKFLRYASRDRRVRNTTPLYSFRAPLLNPPARKKRRLRPTKGGVVFVVATGIVAAASALFAIYDVVDYLASCVDCFSNATGD